MSTSSTEMTRIKNIPPQINFIWLGGPIPQNYLNSILRLVNFLGKSKDVKFEVNLWVDKKDNLISALKKLIKNQVDFNEDATEFLGIRLRMIEEIQPILDSHPVFKEGKNHRDMMYFICREMVGSKNLAAASDLLRYVILLEGGYYFDTDTEFRYPKGSTPREDCSNLGFFSFCTLVFNGLRDESDYYMNGNNDIIATLANHPIIINAIRCCLANYRKLDAHYFEQDRMPLRFAKLRLFKEIFRLSSMDAKRYQRNGESSLYWQKEKGREVTRLGLTMDSTGPGALNEGMRQYFIECNISDEDARGVECRQGLLGAEIRTQSHLTWLSRERPPIESYDDTKVTYTFFEPASIATTQGTTGSASESEKDAPKNKPGDLA